MNYLDILILILILLAAIKGFSRGLIKEVVSFISLFTGIYIASNFSIFLEGYLLDNFPQYEEFISIASFVILFFIIFLSLKLAGIIISKLVKSLHLGLINKTLGVVFGASKVLLIISIILFELNHLSKVIEIIPKKQKQESLLYDHIMVIVPTFLTEKNLETINSLEETIEKKTDDIKKDLNY